MPDIEYELTVRFLAGPLAGYEVLLETLDDLEVGSIHTCEDSTFQVLAKKEIDIDN